jgi:hypothetical protein
MLNNNPIIVAWSIVKLYTFGTVGLRSYCLAAPKFFDFHFLAHGQHVNWDSEHKLINKNVCHLIPTILNSI